MIGTQLGLLGFKRCGQLLLGTVDLLPHRGLLFFGNSAHQFHEIFDRSFGAQVFDPPVFQLSRIFGGRQFGASRRYEMFNLLNRIGHDTPVWFG